MTMVPIPEKEQKVVWFNCNVNNDCEGTQAVMIMKSFLPGIGYTYRYKCLKCKGCFHVQAGSAL